jgi:hypothetical protein
LKTTIHLPFITADKTGPKHEKNWQETFWKIMWKIN